MVMVATCFLLVVNANSAPSTPTIAVFIPIVVSDHLKFVCLNPTCNLEGDAEAAMVSIHNVLSYVT